MKERIFVPSVRRGNGTGHLKRCYNWAGRTGSRIYLPPESGPEEFCWSEIVEDLGWNSGFVTHELTPGALFILDQRETDPGLFSRLSKIGTVWAVDEGGSCRDQAEFLIDTLGNLSDEKPNIDVPLWLDLPSQRGMPVTLPAEGRILITFGGEDPAGLGPLVAEDLIRRCGIDPGHITLIRPAMNRSQDYPSGIVVQDPCPGLKDRLENYDLVITSYGITAFEARYSGTPAALVNPESYHQRLSKKAEFYSLGVKKPDLKRLRRILMNPELGLQSVLDQDPSGFDRFWAAHDGSLVTDCPVCGNSGARKSLMRAPGRTFFRCGSCSLIYQTLTEVQGRRYGKEYFFSEYQAQYGRTYLEDFDHIRRMGEGRIEQILKILGEPGTLLDVGCAYGPFLDAARTAGFVCDGLDLCDDAARHVRDVLGIPAVSGQFPESLTDDRPRRAVTMWYVIEHFSDLDRVLTSVSSLLKEGGVFAFSTPNGRGISGRTGALYASSPRDHHTLFDPRSARRVLAGYGFTIKKIRITGHHGDRFPPFWQRFLGRKGCTLVSRILGLGDTFEVYAQKGSK